MKDIENFLKDKDGSMIVVRFGKFNGGCGHVTQTRKCITMVDQYCKKHGEGTLSVKQRIQKYLNLTRISKKDDVIVVKDFDTDMLCTPSILMTVVITERCHEDEMPVLSVYDDDYTEDITAYLVDDLHVQIHHRHSEEKGKDHYTIKLKFAADADVLDHVYKIADICSKN